MIAIAPNVDVYFLSDNRIVFHKIDFDSQKVEIIEMSGSNNEIWKKLLTDIWLQGVSEKQIASEEVSREAVDVVIRTLVEENLIVSELAREDIVCIEPLKLYFFPDRYFVRMDNIIYIFTEENEACAKVVAERLMRRWGNEDDAILLREQYKDTWQCLPCRDVSFSFLQAGMKDEDFDPSILLNTVIEYRIVFQEGHLVLQKHNTFQDVVDLLHDYKEDSLWRRFISEVISSNLIGEVEELKQDDEKPFLLSQFVFLSSHILPNAHHGENILGDCQVGVGVNRSEACGKALMESLERYCCEEWPENLILCRELELSSSSVMNAEKLVTYLNCQSQFERQKVAKDFECYWTVMHDMWGKDSFVPAEHVWYCFDQVSDQILFNTSTNGVAAHFSFENAAISAICEIIERDAIMIWWLNRLKPSRIRRERLSDKSTYSVNEIEGCGYEVLLLDLTLDLLPVVLAVARNRAGRWPYFFCGASCHYSLDMACQKAVSELSFAIWNRYKTPIRILTPEMIQEPLDHEQYYMNPANGSIIDHLFSGPISDGPPDVKVDTFSEIVRYLQSNNRQVLLKDITCREIKEEQIDIHVVKAIIPGLMPITFGIFNEPLGMERIYELPYNMGIRKDRLTIKSLLENYAPHFFA